VSLALARLKNFLEIFSQKYEVRILIFFKTFKDGIWYNIIKERKQYHLPNINAKFKILKFFTKKIL